MQYNKPCVEPTHKSLASLLIAPNVPYAALQVPFPFPPCCFPHRPAPHACSWHTTCSCYMCSLPSPCALQYMVKKGHNAVKVSTHFCSRTAHARESGCACLFTCMMMLFSLLSTSQVESVRGRQPCATMGSILRGPCRLSTAAPPCIQ